MTFSGHKNYARIDSLLKTPGNEDFIQDHLDRRLENEYARVTRQKSFQAQKGRLNNTHQRQQEALRKQY